MKALLVVVSVWSSCAWLAGCAVEEAEDRAAAAEMAGEVASAPPWKRFVHVGSRPQFAPALDRIVCRAVRAPGPAEPEGSDPCFGLEIEVLEETIARPSEDETVLVARRAIVAGETDTW